MRVPLRSTTLSTTATGGSARMVRLGTTISSLSAPSSLIDRNASFSHDSRTSPMPRSVKVMVEPRAPVSRTGTFLNIPCQELLGLGLVVVPFFQGVAPGRQIVPAGAAGSLRVRRDHLDARLDQVFPVLDALGIALPHQEDDGRGVGRAVLRQPALPVLGDLALLRDGVDVVGQRQRHDIGIQPVDHRARLLARAAMRLVDPQRIAALGFPVRGERLVVLDIKLARRIVRDVQERRVSRRRHGAEQTASEHARREGGTEESASEKAEYHFHSPIMIKSKYT